MEKGKTKGNTGRKANSSVKQNNTVRIIVIGCILVALLIGFYYYLSHRTAKENGEEAVTISKTQGVLLRNLDINYPPSPKEVIKYYCEITQCFYNETHTDEELEELALQMQKLYDDELVANQTQEEYLLHLMSDISSMQKQGYVISSYSTSSSMDVDYFTEDNFEWARLYCGFSIRKGTTMISTNERFLLRKDTDGHWKIYGWELVE